MVTLEQRIAQFTIVLLLALPVIFVPINGKTIGTFPQVQSMGMEPIDPDPKAGWDVLQVDSVLQFYGWRDLVFKSWSKGEVPGWNPHQLGGVPLLANSQSAALYPPHVALGLFSVPTPIAINILAWFHLALAGVGAWFLSRRIGANACGAALAGSAFELSPFMLGWTPLPSVTSTCAWIPWALAGVMLIFQGSRRAGWGLTTLAGAMMILAGHLQFTAYGVMAVVLLVLGLCVFGKEYSERPKAALITASALVVSVAMTCMHWLPVVENSRESHRQGQASKEGYAAAVATAIPIQMVLGAGAPALTGWPNKMIPSEDPSLPEMPHYWPAFTTRGLSFAEGAMAVGLVVVAGLFGWRRKGAPWPMLVVGGFGFLVAIGSPVAALLYFGVPGWAATGSPGRAIVLAVLAACVMAGWGVSQITDKASLKRPMIGLALFTLLSFIAPVLVFSSMKSWLGEDFSVAPQVSLAMMNAVPSIILSALLSALALWSVTHTKLKQYSSVFFIAALLSMLVGFSLPVGNLPPQSPQSSERVAFVMGKWSLFNRPDAFMVPNLATLYGLSDIAGYDSFVSKDSVEMMREINGGEDPAPPENGNMMAVRNPSPNLDALREAGVSEVFTAPGERIFVGGKLATIPVTELRIEQNRIKFGLTGPGEAEIKVRNHPGWRLAIQGFSQPIQPGRWIKFRSPETSPLTAELVFDPWNGRGGILAGVTLFAALVFVVVLWFPARASNGWTSFGALRSAMSRLGRDEDDN